MGLAPAPKTLVSASAGSWRAWADVLSATPVTMIRTAAAPASTTRTRLPREGGSMAGGLLPVAVRSPGATPRVINLGRGGQVPTTERARCSKYRTTVDMWNSDVNVAAQ